ncbi:hypothetical protein [Amycolatopsis sp. cmx-8-4]|uniref:hypothetical protein n=1 Tax=Amycolatopsis sp. cmx-8-4 TaxID=2790947 RepID=UPI003978A29F
MEDRQRAEGKLAAIRDELARVADRAETAVTLAAERASTFATIIAGLTATKPALAEAQTRATTAATRAEGVERCVISPSDRLDAVREEFANAVSAHQKDLEAVQADADRQRAVADQRLAGLQAGHEQTVRSMHETTTRLDAELRTRTARAAPSERTLAHALEVVAQVRDKPEITVLTTSWRCWTQSDGSIWSVPAFVDGGLGRNFVDVPVS